MQNADRCIQYVKAGHAEVPHPVLPSVLAAIPAAAEGGGAVGAADAIPSVIVPQELPLPPKIAYVDIDCRGHFNPYELPTWEQVIAAIERLYKSDSNKVVKALRGGSLGVYRIFPHDTTHYDADDMFEVKGRSFKPNIVEPRPKRTFNRGEDNQHDEDREGRGGSNRDEEVLVTILNAWTGDWIGVPNDIFTNHLRDTNTVVKPVMPQTYRNSRVLNGNRYLVVTKEGVDKIPNAISLCHPTTGGLRSFYTRYTGKVYDCRVCLSKHGGRCPTLIKNEELLKEKQKHLRNVKVLADSTLRHANDLAMTTNVECVSGGGLGMLVNLLKYSPTKPDETFIVGGTNDLHITDDKEFAPIIEETVNKIAEVSTDHKLTILLPAPLTEFPDDLARQQYLTELLQQRQSTNLQVQIQTDVERTADAHPTRTGTYTLLRQLYDMNNQLFWTDVDEDTITTNRYYGNVTALHRHGCRTCDNAGFFYSGVCGDCTTRHNNYDTTTWTTYKKTITDQHYPTIPTNTDDAKSDQGSPPPSSAPPAPLSRSTSPISTDPPPPPPPAPSSPPHTPTPPASPIADKVSRTVYRTSTGDDTDAEMSDSTVTGDEEKVVEVEDSKASSKRPHVSSSDDDNPVKVKRDPKLVRPDA